MNRNGLIVYTGPSELDGQPVVVILTRKSRNRKTGNQIQSWILKADADPVEAAKSGDDSSICGDCPHRPILARETGEPPCYVNIGRAPRAIWLAYRRGSYRRAASIEQVRAFIAGRAFRIGSYGDPFAAPVGLWKALVGLSRGHTGYSHQWKHPRFDPIRWAPLVMASVDSQREADIARAMGLRTFRVSVGLDRMTGEIPCPASAEAGHRTQCADCLLCGGTTKAARNIVIADHARGFERRVLMLQAA